ncbi:FAD-dependent oxidoreductase [Synechococcus sp. CBW1107]|uniref:FAD-dependent oxidoreductase n=1 Tax=Synechococcus sp. CBW1107 TaxID=2789857 RepID=UPI002AD2A25D|nr:FAD-dependent oxidoreductase [Synechococcus sp. CBW1107]CAK6699371.1 Malate:quinone oxidoreductase [Synechococcus sp. CBW1107]
MVIGDHGGQALIEQPAAMVGTGQQGAAHTDVLIVGGGVCGTALLFELARYTDLNHVTLVERYGRLAQVNSRATNNSQTIHCGDIETNYTLEKAVRVKRTAEMIVHYADLLDPATRERCVFRTPKMVLGVGEQECSFLRERFERFAPHFPAMEWLEKEQIAEWEPQVARVNGQLRPEPLGAIGIRRTYTAVDYEALSESFVQQAQQAVSGSDRRLDLRLGTTVEAIEPEGEGFRVRLRVTPGAGAASASARQVADPEVVQEIVARHVVVNAGAHSLLMAQRMGYGLEYSCLPVAGSFYFTPDLLRGKVYTVQNDKLPFAAIHGDPDVRAPGKTRFGPTALLLPLLERYKPASFWEFLQVLRLDWAVLAVFWQLLKITDIRNYILKNLLFEVPWLRRRLFLADARKIVPGMQLQDLSFAEGYGGVRPQLINKQERRLMLGEARLEPIPGLVFNVTPSPGGTCCLGNAAIDLEAIVARLGCSCVRNQLAQELYGEATAGVAELAPQQPIAS